jgi:RNA polymerase sigma factor (sigma-70 family)
MATDDLGGAAELMAILADGTSHDHERSEACDGLLRMCGPAMLRWAGNVIRACQYRRLEPEDVVQEVCASLLLPATAQSYNPARSFAPWLRAVVKNRAHDLARRERRQSPRRESAHLLLFLPSPAADPASVVARDDDLDTLIARLDTDEQELCRLFYLTGLGAADVAARVGRPVEWVYRKLHSARTKLRSFRAG